MMAYLSKTLSELTDDLSEDWKRYPCLEWPYARETEWGYGLIWLEGRPRKVHRVSYAITVGKIPDGHGVLHHCDNPPCFRPIHLFTGTDLDNTHDMIVKGRARHEGQPGVTNPMAKFTAEQIGEIRRLSSFMTQRAIADRFGVAQATIGRIVNSKSYIIN